MDGTDIKLKVLSLEDSTLDYGIIQSILIKSGFSLDIFRVDKEKEFVELIQSQKYDVILADFRLPGFDAFKALKLCNGICPGTPFICVSGAIGEETAIELIQKGAVDYVLKDRLTRLPTAIIRALDENRKKEEILLAEKAIIESENRFRSVLHTALDAIVLIDSSGNITGWNSGAERIFGYLEEEALGKPITTIMPQSFRKKHPESLNHVVSGGTPHLIGTTIELEGIRSDGTVFPIELSLSTYETTSGKYFTGIIRDISKRKFIEAELQKSEEQFRDLYKNAPIGLYRTSPGGKIMLANKALCDMLGYSSYEELATRNLEESGFETQPERKLFIDQLEKTDQILNHEAKWLTREKEVIIVNENIRLIRDSLGKPLYYDGTVVNITERKNAEENLIQSELRFKQVSENLREWIWEVDMMGLYTYVSPIVKEILGYEVEEIIGKKYFFDLFIPSTKEQVKQAAFEMFGRNESFKGLANINIHKDGREIILSTSGLPILDKEGNLSGYRGLDFDITDRVKAQQELEEKINELQRFQRLTVGRELSMIALKSEVNELLVQLGLTAKYKISQ